MAERPTAYNCSSSTRKSPRVINLRRTRELEASPLAKWFIAGAVVVLGVLASVLQAWDILLWIGVLQ
jgi:hypothetical protein